MRDDVVATLAMAHWPSPVAPWFADFRRTAAYSPVLSRWVTVNDFFHRSDRPFEEITPALDDYATAYLAQAAARRDPSPIAAPGRARPAPGPARRPDLDPRPGLGPRRLRGRAELDPELEEALETGRLGEAGRAIDRLLAAEAESLARRIVGEGSAGRPGYLVINPLGVARRAAVLLPDAVARPPPRGAAPRRPVHRGGRLGRRRPPPVRLRLGPPRDRPRPARRARRARSRSATGRSRTSR